MKIASSSKEVKESMKMGFPYRDSLFETKVILLMHDLMDAFDCSSWIV